MGAPRRLAAIAGTLAVAAALALPFAPVHAVEAKLVIWADPIRAEVLKAEFPKGFRGTKLSIVTKDSLATIKNELLTVGPEDGPDVIAAEHDSTGELVAAKLVRRLDLPPTTGALFPSNVLDGFRYNSAIYGLPVQFENLALVTNIALVPKEPATFAKVVTVAERLMKKGKALAGIAVGQGEAGNAYNMYPFFSGLGGYVFGKDAKGNLNPTDVGIANAEFLSNSPQIKAWNDARVISSSLTTTAAKDAFVSGKAPFWVTGPWDLNTIAALPFGYRITAVPSMVTGKTTSPLLGMKGFMVTVHARAHQMKKAADRFVTEGLAGAGVQAAFANAARRLPANVKAAVASPDARLKAFGIAGAAGVPVPNIPQMQDVWAPLGSAWAVTTRGSGATAPVPAFTEAQAKVSAAIAARG